MKPARIKMLLKSLIYTGKIVYNEEIIDGQHEAMIEQEVFEEVQKVLKHSNKKFKIYKNLVFGGLVKCRECGTTMSPTYSNKHTNNGLKRYFYYKCSRAMKQFSISECSIRQVSSEKLRTEIINNLERISCDQMYLENLALRLNLSPHSDFSVERQSHSPKFSVDKRGANGFEKMQKIKTPRNSSVQTFGIQKMTNQRIVSRPENDVELWQTCNFFEPNLMKNVIENVIELCKKENSKFANLKLKNFVNKIIYDPKFIEMEFRYHITVTDENRAELASAASSHPTGLKSRWSEEQNGRVKGAKNFGGIGREELRDFVGEVISESSENRAELASAASSHPTGLKSRWSEEQTDQNLRDSGRGMTTRQGLENRTLSTLDLMDSTDSRGKLGGTGQSLSILTLRNSENSRAECLRASRVSQYESSRDLKNLEKSRAGFVDSREAFSAIPNPTTNRNRIGFINGDTQKLQSNCLINDLNDEDYKEEALSAFPAAVKKMNKYIAGDGIRTRDLDLGKVKKTRHHYSVLPTILPTLPSFFYKEIFNEKLLNSNSCFKFINSKSCSMMKGIS